MNALNNLLSLSYLHILTYTYIYIYLHIHGGKCSFAGKMWFQASVGRRWGPGAFQGEGGERREELGERSFQEGWSQVCKVHSMEWPSYSFLKLEQGLGKILNKKDLRMPEVVVTLDSKRFKYTVWYAMFLFWGAFPLLLRGNGQREKLVPCGVLL